LGIVVITDPLAHFLVLFVVGVVDDVRKMTESHVMREIDTDTAYTSVRPVLAALHQAGPTELATVSCETACEAGAPWRRDAFLNGVRGLTV